MFGTGFSARRGRARRSARFRRGSAATCIALDHVPRTRDSDSLCGQRWFYDRRVVAAARQVLGRWPDKYPRLYQWIGVNLEEIQSFQSTIRSN